MRPLGRCWNRWKRVVTFPYRTALAVMLFAATAALALAACDRGPDTKGVRSIKVVIAEYSKDHTAPFWRALADTYTKQTGIKVDLQVIDWNSIDQQVSTMIQNNQPPDVLNLNSFSSYAKDGLLYSADEVLSPKTRDDFLPAFARGGEYQGKLYGFPILASARAFFYNKELFAKAGIAAPPRTWQEFVDDARKIQALGGGVIGYALPLGPEEAQAEWSIWMWNNGGDWKSDGRWAIDSDRNVQALQFLADLANKEQVTQVNPGKTNRTDGAFQLFKDGKVGMVMGFSPLAAQLDTAGKVSYGVTTMPANAGPPLTLGVEDYLMAFKKKGNQEAVKAFLDLYYQPENITRWIAAEGFLPVTASGLKQMRGNPKLQPYLDALPNARLAPITDPVWDKVKLDVQQNIGLAVQPGGNPKQVLEQLQKNAVAAEKG
ncbi:MAG TPA: extracellular solute-binding protein [Candidatus Methylomirabilis sp.]|nr:extracellular solute-binding protein [Candidatus Methylomirabilis sp.]